MDFLKSNNLSAFTPPMLMVKNLQNYIVGFSQRGLEVWRCLNQTPFYLGQQNICTNIFNASEAIDELF